MYEGVTLSTALVNAGLTSFDKILEKNARELELIVNRHPPFGNQVRQKKEKHILFFNRLLGKRSCQQNAKICTGNRAGEQTHVLV